jgi:hypothetical protein
MLQMMAPDSVSGVGGASAPVESATTTTKDTTTSSANRGATFGDALKVARSTASKPEPAAGTPSAEALARAKQLGLAGNVGASDVLGHRYARIEGGSQDGHYVNTSGNARNGQTFEIVHRGGHVYHVYADKAFRVPSEEKPAAPAQAAAQQGGSAAAESA